MGGVKECCTSTGGDITNSPLSLAILVVGINSAERHCLTSGTNIEAKELGVKKSVVTMIMGCSDSMGSKEALKSQFSFDS